MEQENKQKPISKDYLTSSLQDFDSEVLDKKYLKYNDEQLHTHANKEVLNRLDVSDTGALLFDGNEINNSVSATAGKSAYEIAQENGFEGTESEWLESLKGRDGTDGTDGTDGADGENGADGKDGKSAYEIAVQNGFEGTEPEWLDSLKGDQIDAYTKEETDAKFVTAPQIWTDSNQFKFGIDENGNYGYIKDGADTVTPFKSDVSVTGGEGETGELRVTFKSKSTTGTTGCRLEGTSGSASIPVSIGDDNYRIRLSVSIATKDVSDSNTATTIMKGKVKLERV